MSVDASILCLYYGLRALACIDDVGLSLNVTKIELLIAELFPQHKDQKEMLFVFLF